jgi:predicted MPP superfamily phosphohydrolase
MSLLSLILFLLAAAGHAVLLVFGINWMYGTRFRGWYVTSLRWVKKLLIVAGPVAILIFWPDVLRSVGAWWDLPWLLLGYLSVCWYLGGVVLPWQTLKRLRRRVPHLQLSNHTRTIDVAAELGHKPYGRGLHALLARLPKNEIFHVDFNDKTFALPQLPAEWDGLSILHLTDLHLCGVPDRSFYEHLMDLCAKEPADLLAITGDILDSDEHYEWIAPVLGRLRWKVAAFALLGNHDALLDVPRIRREVEQAGIEMIGSGWKQIEVRDRPLVVIGNEMPWLPPAPDLSDCPADGFRLCLSHTPDTLPWAKDHRIDLMLAGHNHGGQIRFPILGSVLVPSRYGRRYDCGTFHEPPTLLHVGRGLGGTYPWRYNCRPEITRILLRQSTSS